LARDRDYYSILQVSRGANQEAIERAYERLARLYDPAVSKKPKAAARWQEITEAFDVLSDKQKRSLYDRHGRIAAASGAAPQRERGRFAAPAFLSSPFFFAGATVSFVVLAVVALVAISVLGGDGDEAAVSQPSASPATTSATPTPVGQTPAPTGPAAPPEVTGEEVTTATGLKYIDLQPGSGASPTLGQTISVNYTGWLQADGSKFDSSIDRGEPSEFALGEVIEGWNEGIASMQVGGKRRLIIPPELAYGEAGRSGIPPNSTLIFDVELLAIQ